MRLMQASLAIVLLIMIQALSGWGGACFALPGEEDETSPTDENAFEGRVADRTSGEPLVGAYARLVELQRVAHTDENGSFRFTNLPQGHFTLGIHLHGYSSYHDVIVIPYTGECEVRLSADTRYEEKITVTAAPWATNLLETPQQVDVVDADEAKKEGTASLGDALKKLPGVDSIGTGDALGTPVIRGLSENRIRVLHEGIPLNHQQFSFRHSPNIEPMFAQRLEVVRGPLSVLYGPDAMGGVINVVQAPLPTAHEGQETFHGEVGAGYGSNAGTWSTHAEAEGAAGGFGWRIGAVSRDAGDTETPDETLSGTDYEQLNGLAAVGYSGSWGRARLRWHYWEDDVGFYRPADFRLDLEDDLVAGDLYIPTGAGDVELLVGRQNNIRQAYPAALQGSPAVDLKLETTTCRAAFKHRHLGRMRGRIAVEYVGMENTPRALRALLPDYDSDAMAVMFYEEARFFEEELSGFDRLVVSAGGRWDTSELTVPVDEARGLPQGYDNDWQSFTGSVGAVLRLAESFSLAANLGRGWRPPNAFELFADGIHGGVSAIQIGNLDLVEETNINMDLSARYQSSRFRAVLTGFRNDFDDFIYLADTGDVQETPDGELPVFEYRQDNALIEGLELQLEGAVLRWLDLGGNYAWIDSENKQTGTSLPQMPPNRLLLFAQLHTDRAGWLTAPYCTAEMEYSGAGEVSGPDEPFGTPTDSYTLFNIRSGFTVPARYGAWGVDLSVRNLLDEEYTDFLYPYKPWASNPGRNISLSLRFIF